MPLRRISGNNSRNNRGSSRRNIRNNPPQEPEHPGTYSDIFLNSARVNNTEYHWGISPESSDGFANRIYGAHVEFPVVHDREALDRLVRELYASPPPIINDDIEIRFRLSGGAHTDDSTSNATLNATSNTTSDEPIGSVYGPTRTVEHTFNNTLYEGRVFNDWPISRVITREQMGDREVVIVRSSDAKYGTGDEAWEILKQKVEEHKNKQIQDKLDKLKTNK